MADALASALSEVAAATAKVPFAYLVSGHCVAVAALIKGKYAGFLQSYVLGLLLAFGGGLLTSLLLQDPEKAGIAFFTLNSVGVAWTAAWWLINYCPGDAFARLHALLPVRAATRVCLATLRSALIVQRVDVAAAAFPGVAFAALAIGTLAGSGGKLIIDLADALTGASKGPSELAAPGFALRSAWLAAGLHYALAHALHALSPAQGLGLVTSLLVGHGLAAELTGRPLDFTEPLVRLAHAVSLVPAPRAKAAAKPRGRPAKAAATAAAAPAAASPGAAAAASPKKGGRTPRRKTLLGKKD